MRRRNQGHLPIYHRDATLKQNNQTLTQKKKKITGEECDWR